MHLPLTAHPREVGTSAAARGDWSGRTGNATRLRRLGYNADTFQPGQIVSVRGNLAADAGPVMNLEEVVLEDGTGVNFLDPVPASRGSLAAAATAQRGDVDNPRNLTGLWVWVSDPLPPEARARAPKDAVFVDAFGQAPEMPVGENGNYPLTEKGRAFQANWTAAYDECRPRSAWMGITAPYFVEFDEPRAGRLQVRYEYLDQERAIWLDERSHPPLNKFPRTFQGHFRGSLGRGHLGGRDGAHAL